MRGRFPLGLVTLGLTLLLGLWLTYAPFVWGDQPLGTGWSLQTRDDLTVAILVIGLSLAGIAGYTLQALREAAHAAQQRRRAEQGQGQRAGQAGATGPAH